MRRITGLKCYKRISLILPGGLRPSLDHGLHGPPFPLRVFVFLGPGGKEVSLRLKARPCWEPSHWRLSSGYNLPLVRTLSVWGIIHIGLWLLRLPQVSASRGRHLQSWISRPLPTCSGRGWWWLGQTSLTYLTEQVEIVKPDLKVHDSPLAASQARYAIQLNDQQLAALRDPLLQTNREPVHQLVCLLGVPLAKRAVIWPGTCLPTLMANYGRQHLLPRRLLTENGLLTWLVYDERGVLSSPLQALRYLQPFEALWMLGFPLFGPHPVDPAVAMLQVGNSVSPFTVAQFVTSVLKHVGWPQMVPFEPGLRSAVALGDVLTTMHVVKRGRFFHLASVAPPQPSADGPCNLDLLCWRVSWTG